MYESQISFTLDTVCPWTYLGKRRLEKALEQIHQSPDAASNVHFTVKYQPYQLYPDFPLEGQDKHAWYMNTKYNGSGEMMATFEKVMGAYGADEGIKFNFNGPIANTLPAHRIIQYFQENKGPKVADKLIKALYKLYFEDQQHPSSNETLLAACKDAGIPDNEATKVVEDESEGLVDTKAALQEQRSNGIDSVPYVMIEGRRRDITLVGAKEVADYVKALQTVIKEST